MKKKIDRKKMTIYAVLISIPVIFLLFLLAVVDILFFLLGIIAVLSGLLLIKQKHPELFVSKKANMMPPRRMGSTEKSIVPEPPHVYMVLSSRDSHSEKRIEVDKTPYYIGREKDNDLIIDGGKVSRHHLRIEYNSVEDACYAIDPGSANGTSLNSRKMAAGQRYRLRQRDQIMIDGRTFTVEYAHYEHAN